MRECEVICLDTDSDDTTIAVFEIWCLYGT